VNGTRSNVEIAWMERTNSIIVHRDTAAANRDFVI
jgi:hypothetical protein